jgi:hypothetical protein
LKRNTTYLHIVGVHTVEVVVETVAPSGLRCILYRIRETLTVGSDVLALGAYDSFILKYNFDVF